jgi:hypothetical protein
MAKKIKGNLVLMKDTTFDESIEVEGNIKCEKERYNLKVAGNIDAWNIVAGNIDAWNIVAGNIDAWNIDAWNIDAGNIDAGNIDAWNIVAGNIDAGNIDAWNIVAWDIFAWDIIFCKFVKLKDKTKGKIKAKAIIRKRYELKQREFESD